MGGGHSVRDASALLLGHNTHPHSSFCILCPDFHVKLLSLCLPEAGFQHFQIISSSITLSSPLALATACVPAPFLRFRVQLISLHSQVCFVCLSCGHSPCLEFTTLFQLLTVFFSLVWAFFQEDLLDLAK